MNIFFDTEFVDNGRTIELISIGLVAQDGRELYLESAECDVRALPSWHQEHVVPHLRGGESRRLRVDIRDMVRQFCGTAPLLWARYGAYDWVALCQLYGPMIDLPESWPRQHREIKMLEWMLGDRARHLPQQTGGQHSAIDDARWNLEAWLWLVERLDLPREIIG